MAKQVAGRARKNPSVRRAAAKSAAAGAAGSPHLFRTAVYALLALLFVRTFLFEPFSIPSGSMIPTLLVGDYVLVSKFSYGYSRYSFPWLHPPFRGRILGALPARGDVAVFRLPRDPSVDYIKRIVGLPGDTVQMRHGRLYLDGKEVPRTPDGTFTATGEGPPMLLRRYRETLPGGPTHAILMASDNGPLDNTPRYRVPPGYLFAMGDNRDNSLDSRVMGAAGVGYIPLANLVGRADLIFFSTRGTAPLWEFWLWPSEIRWNRLFTRVH